MLVIIVVYFDKGFEFNNFVWVICNWEMFLVEVYKIYGYWENCNGLEGLVIWFNEMCRRWLDVKFIIQGEFGLFW